MDSKIVARKPILENLIRKFADPINHYVYKLTYAGKYIIVKGKTIDGSLYLIEKGYWWFTEKKADQSILYLHFYRHIKRHKEGRFTVKILLYTTDHFELLLREQQELDKARYDKNCLNNNIEAYVPQWNELTGKYLWMGKMAVLSFKKYLKSPQRKALLDQYKGIRSPKPAKSA